MKAGQFNLNEYLEKLNEAVEGGNIPDKEGMIIPPENQKAYQWLKKEYQKAQTEVKVEINMGGSNFEPGYDMQTKLDSVKDFKPGMFGEVKTADTENKSSVSKTKDTLDPNKSKGTFGAKEGEKTKSDEPEKPASKTPPAVGKPAKEEKEKPEKEEEEEEEKEEKPESKKEEEPEVKKIDLKTKKQ